MKAKKLSVLIVLTVALGSFLLVSFVPQDKAAKPWDVPAKYLEMTNPQTTDDADMIKVGKMLYSKHCKSCHGSKGLGDGPKAKQLDTPAGNFSSEAFHIQSDGEMYYKSFVGRDEMPNFEKKITDEEDSWAIITYMRATFKK